MLLALPGCAIPFFATSGTQIPLWQGLVPKPPIRRLHFLTSFLLKRYERPTNLGVSLVRKFAFLMFFLRAFAVYTTGRMGRGDFRVKPLLLPKDFFLPSTLQPQFRLFDGRSFSPSGLRPAAFPPPPRPRGSLRIRPLDCSVAPYPALGLPLFAG